MRERDRPDQCKPDPDATFVARSTFVESGEAFEHPRPLVGRDARSIVVDEEHSAGSAAVTRLDADGELDARRGVTARVVDQVAHQTSNRVRIGDQPRRTHPAQIDLDATVVMLISLINRGGEHHLVEIDLGVDRPDLVETREREEVVDE